MTEKGIIGGFRESKQHLSYPCQKEDPSKYPTGTQCVFSNRKELTNMELEIWSKASFGNIKGQHLPFRARFYSWPHFSKAEARVLLRTFPQGEEPEDSENTGEEAAKTRDSDK